MAEKKGFFKKIIEKLDQKLEKESKKQCCSCKCEEDSNNEDEDSCCKK